MGCVTQRIGMIWNWLKAGMHGTPLLAILAFSYVGKFASMGFAYFEYHDDCMGTRFSLLIDHDDQAKAEVGARTAFREAKKLELIFSDYIDHSEVSRFSDSSYSSARQRLSEELFTVLRYGQRLSRDTNGSFDMTLGQLSRLWRIARFKKAMPAEEKISRALSMTGFRHLKLFPKTREALLAIPGIEMDLGGIAKGHTADCMLKSLTASGLNRCLIDAGGDLVLGDPPRKSKGWQIKVGGLDHSGLPYLGLANCAVATSGDMEQFVTLDGKRFSHLIDPLSGLGLTTQAQVTVIAPTGIKADSLASACIVLGIEKSRDFLRSQRQTRAYFMERKEQGVILTVIGDDG